MSLPLLDITDFIGDFCQEFSDYLLTNSFHSTFKLSTKELCRCGDVVFSAKPRATRNRQRELENKSEVLDVQSALSKLLERASEIKSREWPLQISRVDTSMNKFSLLVYFERASTFSTVLQAYVKTQFLTSDNYSRPQRKEFDNLSHTDINLTELRVLILDTVANNLLNNCFKANETQINIKWTSKSSDDLERLSICGPVLNIDGVKDNKISAEELYKKRTNDMRMMAQHKYGVQIKSLESWQMYFDNLGRAAVTVEMLQQKPQKAIKISLENLSMAHKGAAFIFYNCARVSALFKEFHRRVSKGFYPPLPPIEKIDFSLLSEPEEWELLFVYILQFPVVLKSCISYNAEYCTASPQNLVSFLSHLSSLFSAYYRRLKILTDPREHLIPLLHARIYLLKVLQMVFHKALSILDIDPIKEM